MEGDTRTAARPALSTDALDRVLTAQIAVAWAGESGEEPRLGWWRTDLASEFGGEDLFRRLLPQTWRWAVLQAAREAARRHDLDLRRRSHDPDQLLTLFCLGAAVDVRLEERLVELKGGPADPADALPGLRDVPGLADSDPLHRTPFSPDRFAAWLASHGTAEPVSAPLGRRLPGAPPDAPDALVRRLLPALAPLGDAYPMPHFRHRGGREA